MDLHGAEILAKELISVHNPQVSFSWSRTKNRFGDYFYSSKILRLSKVLTPLRPEYEVRNTILHELAHSLTPGDHHGRLWQIQMLKFGLNPSRCSTTVADLSKIPGAWYGVCSKGHRSTRTWNRKPTLTYSCGTCKPGKFDPLHVYSWKRNPR